jgi:DNA-binding FadR family transcriptional regulator
MAIGQTVTHHIAYSADPRDVADILLHDHRVIAAAIIAGKPIKSRDEMRIHLEGVAAFYNRLSGGAVLDQLIEWR